MQDRRKWADMVGVQINFFLIGTSHEIQTAVVTEGTPFNVNNYLTINTSTSNFNTATP